MTQTPHTDMPLMNAVAQSSDLALSVNHVITSYSIHYTKLYDPDVSPRTPGSVSVTVSMTKFGGVTSNGVPFQSVTT